MKIVFRTDSSVIMGSGHVMRCLTLAKVLEDFGVDITFLCRSHDGNINELISKHGFYVTELINSENSEPLGKYHKGEIYEQWLGVSQEQDALDTIEKLGEPHIDCLVVDHYGLGIAWEKAIRPYVNKLVVIDDLANRQHECDVLLDQNWFGDLVSRYEGLLPVGSKKLLGPDYALLRPEFAEEPKKRVCSGDISRVFIFFGGSDPHNLTGLALSALSEPKLSKLEVDVVVGENNPLINEITKIASYRPKTYLHIQVDRMASIMAKSDIALGSGGVNTWERLCLKIPSLVITTANNQIATINDLHNNGYIEYLGHKDSISKADIINGLLKWNELEQPEYKDLRIDGKGAKKVAQTIISQI